MAVIQGGTEDDVYGGTAGDDRMFGFSGNDSLTNSAGRDVIFGGNDDDTIVLTVAGSVGHGGLHAPGWTKSGVPLRSDSIPDQ